MPENEYKVKIFYSYSHKDEYLRDRFEIHMAGLKRKKIIEQWHDRKILPGQQWEDAITGNLNTADIIIFLVSADFLASDYCYDNEVIISIERHKRGECLVIPVILRDCDWEDSPFEKIQGLPKDMKPVLSRHWYNEDEALMDVVQGLKKVILKIKEEKQKLIDSVYEEKVNFAIWK